MGTRSNCGTPFSEAIISTTDQLTVTVICNGRNHGQYTLPSGTTRITTGCSMTVGTSTLINGLPGNQSPPPPIIIEKEFFDLKNMKDILFLSVCCITFLILLLNLAIFLNCLCKKCKRKSRRSYSQESVEMKPLDEALDLLESMREDQIKIANAVTILEKKRFK